MVNEQMEYGELGSSSIGSRHVSPMNIIIQEIKAQQRMSSLSHSFYSYYWHSTHSQRPSTYDLILIIN